MSRMSVAAEPVRIVVPAEEVRQPREEAIPTTRTGRMVGEEPPPSGLTKEKTVEPGSATGARQPVGVPLQPLNQGGVRPSQAESASGDLAILKVLLNKKEYQPNSPVVLTAVVANSGRQPYRQVRFRVLLQGHTLSEQQLSAVAAGQQTITARFQAPREGEYAVVAVIDPDNRIEETDKSNNSGETILSVAGTVRDQEAAEERPQDEREAVLEVPPPVAADLEVVKLTWSPEQVSTVDKPIVAIILRNNGPARSASLRVRCQVEERLVGEELVKELGVGQNRRIELRLPPLPHGAHALIVQVDPEPGIEDENMRNNHAQSILEVGNAGEPMLQPDATAQSVPEVDKPMVLGSGADKIVVSSPVATDKPYFGGNLKISWTNPAAVSSVRISLMNSNGTKEVLLIQGKLPTIPAGGSMVWSPIPTTLAENTYRIRVADALDASLYGQSAPFPISTVPMIIVDKIVDISKASIIVTSPAKNDVWSDTAPKKIVWQKTGSMADKVNIILYRPGKSMVIGNETAAGVTAWYLAKNQPNSGMFDGTAMWAKLNPCLRMGGYFRIRVQTIDGAVFGDSAVFSLGQAAVKITAPSDGAVWKHMAKEVISWTMTGSSCSNRFDIYLVQDDKKTKPDTSSGLTLQPLPIPIAMGYGGTEFVNPLSYIYSVYPTLSAGSYRLYVVARDTPLLADYKTITIKAGSNSATGTGYLLPGQPDLAITDVVSEGSQYVRATITNHGASYTGPVGLYWLLTPESVDPMITFKDATPSITHPTVQLMLATNGLAPVSTDINIANNQSVSVNLFLNPFPYASLDTQKYPLYVPMGLVVAVQPLAATDSDMSNNKMMTQLCMTKKADVVARHYLAFYTKSGAFKAMNRGETIQFDHADLTWITQDTFRIKLFTRIYNYGCATASVPCYLFVDQQPGIHIGTYNVAPGQRQDIEKNVDITAAVGVKHQLVFVAAPDEQKNEPYPNGYMNNFVMGWFNIPAPDLSVKGSGW